MKHIPLFKPYMGREEERAIIETLRSGWITLGPKVEAFEKAFAHHVGAKHAVALNSATSALHLALIVSGVQKGDEVITTALTFASTAEAILYVGAKPVFADIESDTLNIAPASIEERITKKTKAIIAVHYGGQPCDMRAINDLARRHSLVVIEDAAHAAGSSYRGKKVGGGKNITCFSFHAVKNLATGDGGMITGHDATADARLRRLRWMGINKSTRERETAGGYRWDYDIDAEGGFKYHMNDIAAAIGLVQLEKLEAMNMRRTAIANTYDSVLVGSAVHPVVQRAGGTTSRHNYCVLLPAGTDRERLIAHLSLSGISSGVHYKPLYHHPRYRRFGSAKQTPVTEDIWPRILLLPCHPHMSIADARRVAHALLAAL